jgi:hypothetical protein
MLLLLAFSDAINKDHRSNGHKRARIRIHQRRVLGATGLDAPVGYFLTTFEESENKQATIRMLFVFLTR